MLAVVCFQWNNGFREYLPEYVNVLARGVRRNLSVPHRFICITDETDGFSADVQVIPTPEAAQEVAKMPSPEGKRFPASYRRLWAFSKEAGELGDRLLMLDIDCVITWDLTPLLEPDVDFIGWRPNTAWGGHNRIGGGTWLLKTGTRTHVWETFSAKSAAKARAAGYRGSDQAWMSYCLAEEVVWPKNSGIYQAQQMKGNGFRVLPDDARIVHFNGEVKPWQLTKVPWVRQHWV